MRTTEAGVRGGIQVLSIDGLFVLAIHAENDNLLVRLCSLTQSQAYHT